MKQIILICLALSLFGSGCTLFKPKEPESAEELVTRGMEQFNKGNYKNSLEFFDKLRDWYPFSKYAILAELKIADSHYHLKEYEDAIFAYEEFIGLHPRNEAIPYVLYQIGRCYFDQMDTIDRDQSVTRKALESFRLLKKQYPENEYALKVEEHINICLKSLAGHEFYIGLFYYKSKHYQAALYRFKSVLTKYPDVGVHQKALRYLALCEEKLAQQQLN
jgi:outer membrane protein assembly factor BamD